MPRKRACDQPFTGIHCVLNSRRNYIQAKRCQGEEFKKPELFGQGEVNSGIRSEESIRWLRKCCVTSQCSCPEQERRRSTSRVYILWCHQPRQARTTQQIETAIRTSSQSQHVPTNTSSGSRSCASSIHPSIHLPTIQCSNIVQSNLLTKQFFIEGPVEASPP